MTRRIEFTVADEIGEKYDEARGHEPLASWIKRALESALGGDSSAGASGAAKEEPLRVEAPKLSASSRASDPRSLAMQRQARLNKAKS